MHQLENALTNVGSIRNRHNEQKRRRLGKRNIRLIPGFYSGIGSDSRTTGALETLS